MSKCWTKPKSTLNYPDRRILWRNLWTLYLLFRYRQVTSCISNIEQISNLSIAKSFISQGGVGNAYFFNLEPLGWNVYDVLHMTLEGLEELTHANTTLRNARKFRDLTHFLVTGDSSSMHEDRNWALQAFSEWVSTGKVCSLLVVQFSYVGNLKGTGLKEWSSQWEKNQSTGAENYKSILLCTPKLCSFPQP